MSLNDNAGLLEKAISATALARYSPNVAALTQAETASETLLPYLAQSESVPYWNSNLSLSEKRELILNAPAFYALAGSAQGIDQALKLLDLDYTLTPWHESGGSPYTANLTIRINRAIGKDTDDALRRLVQRLIALRDNIAINLIVAPKLQRQRLSIGRMADVLSVTPQP